MSVPHSGTRSLLEHLGEERYWHFGQNDANLAEYDGHIDIPIRNPIDVAISWDARYVNEYGTKTPKYLLEGLDKMLDLISSNPERCTLYRMEDLPVVERTKGPESVIRTTRRSPRIDKLHEWMTGDKLDFYGKYYQLEWH